jgi:alpha-tubulin suppressor-like RCC1 family protein
MTFTPYLTAFALCASFGTVSCASTVQSSPDVSTTRDATAEREDTPSLTDAPLDTPAPLLPCAPGSCPPREGMRIGSRASYVFNLEGVTRAWGVGDYLGVGTMSGFVMRPIDGPNLGPLRELSVAGEVSCALTVAGRVFCWGITTSAALGNGEVTQTAVPLMVPLPVPVSELVATSGSVCASAPPRSMWCWGSVVDPAGYERIQTSPRQELLPFDVDRLLRRSSSVLACVIDVRGSLWCRGTNDSHRLLVDGVERRGTFERLPLPFQVTDASLGARTVCVVDPDGAVWCWGANEQGVVPGAPMEVVRPTRIEGLPPVTRVSAGYGYACAIGRGGELWCWGNNYGGSVDPSVRNDRLPVTRVTGIPPVDDVDCYFITCAHARTTGNIWCWGGTMDEPVETVVQ